MFGDNLKQARKNAGFTLEQLAELYNVKYNAGMSKGTLSKYENNKQEPMISVVNNLASILNVSTDFLLGNKKSSLRNNAEELNAAYFRLKKGLEPYELNEKDAEYLINVFKAHKKRNKEE